MSKKVNALQLLQLTGNTGRSRLLSTSGADRLSYDQNVDFLRTRTTAILR